MGSIPTEVKDFFFTSCGYLLPFTRANAQWVIHGSTSTLIYTSELILCFTIYAKGLWALSIFSRTEVAHSEVPDSGRNINMKGTRKHYRVNLRVALSSFRRFLFAYFSAPLVLLELTVLQAEHLHMLWVWDDITMSIKISYCVK